jgi:hypothetical protein
MSVYMLAHARTHISNTTTVVCAVHLREQGRGDGAILQACPSIISRFTFSSTCMAPGWGEAGLQGLVKGDSRAGQWLKRAVLAWECRVLSLCIRLTGRC